MGRTVTVACSVPNGVTLRLMERRFDDGTGYKPMVRVGDPVVLKGPSTAQGGVNNHVGEGAHVMNEGIDHEWIEKWLKQNEKSPLVIRKDIFIAEDAEPRPTT